MNTDNINKISNEEDSEEFKILSNEMLNKVYNGKTKYGYYSKKQQDVTGKLFIYLNPNGDNVAVTTISDKDKDTMDKNFDDIIYMGEVTSYVKKYNIHSRS